MDGRRIGGEEKGEERGREMMMDGRKEIDGRRLTKGWERET